MRVLLVADRYWPAVGGVESYLRDLAQELSKRHQVSVLALRTDNGEFTRLTGSLEAPPRFEAFEDGDVDVRQFALDERQRRALSPFRVMTAPGLRRFAYGWIRLPLMWWYGRVAADAVASSVEQCDVVHVFGHGLPAYAAMREAASAGKPVLVTPFAHEGQWGVDPASAWLYRRADRVLALLRTEAGIYERLGVAPDRLDVVGVCSPGIGTVKGQDVRHDHGIAGRIVLFLGVRRAYKGFDLLLEAIRRLPADLDATFAFVGPGPPLEVPDGPRVIDVGPVSSDEKAAWLSAADLLCLPSRGEIFPISILEGWSVATPALASDIPSLEELISTTGGGWNAPLDPDALAAALLERLADPDGLEAAGERGHAHWAQRWTVPAVAAVHEELYRQSAGT